MPVARARFVLGLMLAIPFTAAPAQAEDIDGVWLRERTGQLVTSFRCGGGLGLKGTKEGVVIMCGAKPIGGGIYEGQLKNPDDGKTYAGTSQITGDKLVLKGCVFGGLICKGETLRRVE